ncbi:MAG: hypothetical protein IH940_12335, partial [Acidobacteria bacterium]|nr:hypothetical protein [Acidobacteriota bacterium]
MNCGLKTDVIDSGEVDGPSISRPEAFMRRKTDLNPSHQRGAALIEYVLMVFVVALSIGVGVQGLEHGVEEETKGTASGISGDPYVVSSTVTSSTVLGPTTTKLAPVVNQKPVVDVPEFTIVPLDRDGVSPFKIRTMISDDITLLDVMEISVLTEAHNTGWVTYPNLSGDLYAHALDDVNDPKQWIEGTYTAVNTGIFKL